MTNAFRPRWLRDLRRFLPLKSQFVLSGNVRDLQVIDSGAGTPQPAGIIDTLEAEMEQAGYQQTLVYNPVIGFFTTALGADRQAAEELMRELHLQPENGRLPGGLDLLRETIPHIVAYQSAPIALIIDFASRLVVRSDMLADAEHQLFTGALVASHSAQARPHGEYRRPFFNTIVWVVEKESDVPDWLIIDNPFLRSIPVAKPDHRARRSIASVLVGILDSGGESGVSEEEIVDEFVERTEGLLLADMKAISQLARSEGVAAVEIGEAVRRYKLGVTEDPWKNLDRRKVAGGEEFIKTRVKGQDHAVTHMLDIIKRAVTGVGATRRSGRPRGIAFLAGPTGVGKTELAKTITSLLFGDDSAYIRFDMSEFSAEHADQRLIGAPPGYVGYDAGGELTNAIREKPFSVVLFDEIEKAHPRILDKFLQILDDGVLTSGRGDRVYFSEAFIVFTSNLGIYKTDALGERVPNVTIDDPFEEVSEKVTNEIERYFKVVLNRPEILNRIGDNLIVFDYIRPEVGELIMDHMISAILADVAEQGIEVRLAAQAQEQLRRVCLADLSNGGRGIRNKLEAYLVNPLARALFDCNAASGTSFEVASLSTDDTVSVGLVPANS